MSTVDDPPESKEKMEKNGDVIEIPMNADASSDEYSTDDDMLYCDCIAVALSKSLPGTPGKKGIIPYTSVYDSQAEARKRGYWIPGVPVNAKISKVEKNTDRIHFINLYWYTIDLEHGPYKWSVRRNFKDFTMLNNRLRAHRAAERIRAPMRRAQERVDEILEQVGLDFVPDHKEDCPYFKKEKAARREKLEVLERSIDGIPALNGEEKIQKRAPLAMQESVKEEQFKSLEQAVQSGILSDEADDEREGRSGEKGEEGGAKKSKVERRRRMKHHLPHFPIMPEGMVSDHEQRRQQLESWLQMVLHIPVDRNHHETAEFLEVSRWSFVNELGGKSIEGFVKKRPGGARVFVSWKQCCVRYMLPWSKRWLMVRDSFVAYMDPRTEEIRLVLLMDKDFQVMAGGKEVYGIPEGLVLMNTQHELQLKCRRVVDTLEYKRIIESAMATPSGSIWLEPHRFGSTFPVRENSYAKWFVDARSFMSQAADMMELAREEIFIADWWLSPEIYMKRPATEGTKWRLDQILKRKAEQGVKIFVLMYKEMEMALGLNSIYTKKTLQALHPNIKVMRHPDHNLSNGTFFWAHHEKLIVIDQLIAFVGGVDLCFGRWDDHHHLLTDLGSVQFAGNHALTAPTTSDFGLLRGMRQLASASTGLSPLGLEEHEEVPKPDAIEIVRKVEPKKVEEVDEVDHAAHSVTKIMITDTEGMNKGQQPIEYEEKVDEEIVYHEKGTNRPIVTILKKTRRAKSASSPSTTKEEKEKEKERPATTENGEKREGKRKTSRRATSAQTRRVNGGDSVHAKGYAPSMIERNVNAGMDLAAATKAYKEYVESGVIQKEKMRAQTPPLSASKKNPLSRTVEKLKTNRAKRRWRQVLDTDDVNGEYELEWLRLKKEEVDVDGLGGGTKLWVGKDYVNYIHKDFVEVDLPFNDFIDRGVTPRMPWHDIHSATFGVAARDVARHFIQRWNATKTEKLKEYPEYPYLLPKSYESVKVPRFFKNMSTNCTVQVIRSVSKWSALVNKTEDSIQQAYLSLIANSKHYIYIENQFFVSMIDSNDVYNEICNVICQRVLRAHREKTNYRVYIIIPLMPGFEGDVGAPGGSSLQAVLHWTYVSLSRGPNSLFEKLKQSIDDPSKYISVCSLRTHDTLCKKLVSELIYVHCKLLIVDDEHTIIGSANINDRSQAGNRDSEVCLLISDTHREKSVMDGRPYEAGSFARSLRIRCMQEHLGLLTDCKRPARFRFDVSLDDPVTDSFYVDVWQMTAKLNTTIYEEVFRAYPTDQVESFEELKKWTQQMSLAEYSPQQAEERLRDVNGVLVEFPMNFLVNAKLTPGITSKEGLVPNSVFT
ncbi:hypothetical protein PFISCL1PPCAC_6030 [Pristionchus fissidentatus]|uniref:Phospholipase n=1 Tax=Pristionchus fissidentatus TaxID=1538716 RepID=A0AAV5V6H9_9BILA|nr:hypothetical protein PFISCL1PPCAC_6030 [Pristionchus fissidentatus]